mgnify:CR=1 FL=1|jgi:GDP-L-fucose synthase
MKILITGGTGMVGRNLLEHSDAGQYKILTPSSKELDLRDRNSVKKFLSTELPDLIIHSAGMVGGIQANIANPVGFLRDNVEIGVNVIGCADQVGIPNLINLGSSCMYPREAKNPLIESSMLKGELEPTNEGYALAKIVSTKLCQYISNEDPNKNYKTVIPCNLFGRYDKFDSKKSHLIPSVIRKLHEAKIQNKPVIDIWGDGTARREFMLASDAADFIFFAILNLNEMPQNINIGLGRDYSINDYYEVVASVVGYEGTFEHDLTKPVGMKQKLVDVEKMHDFGWVHKNSLEDGIKKTYDYYKGLDENEL